jgi:transcription factor IIIB subunit 2
LIEWGHVDWLIMTVLLALGTGRRKIQAMINALRLPDRFTDQAQRFYSLALNNNFVRGRRTNYVVSACLYIVCRMEKTSHMLIDFSDLLQVSFSLFPSKLKSRASVVDQAKC